MKLVYFGLIAILSLFAVTANPAMAQKQKFINIDLTPAIVDAFLTSMPDIAALADRYEGKVPRGNGPIGGLENLAYSTEAQSALNATVRPYGFGDYKTWIIVAQNVMATFVYVKVGDVRSQMSGAMAALQNNPSLTPQQKAALTAQLGKASAPTGADRPSDNNIAVITPMMAKIETSMNAMSKR